MQYDRKYFQGRRSFFYSMGGYRDVGLYFNRLARWFRPHTGRGPLLDVGCAYGFLLARFNDGRDLAGCDVSAWAIQQAIGRVPRGRFSVLDPDGGLPYPDASFSAVLCTDVLEHLAPDDQGRLLSESARVLAPGGRFCMTTPNLNFLRRRLYGGADRREAHVGMRRLGELKRELGRQNLRTLEHWTFLHGFLPGRFRSAWLPECALVARKEV
ncbi:MAG: class I SAM-dependent methyltransferase [Planctomycetota bacterium]|nr:class I SAM-dependent methyltransferase [Planctomycetota bacterium]